MLITVSADGATLLETDDFKRFKVVVSDADMSLERAGEAFAHFGEIENRETAWVREQALREWNGGSRDPLWQDGLTEMIMQAERYGWVAAGGRIRAHVEWAFQDPDTAHV